MDRKTVFVMVLSATGLLLAITAVTGHSHTIVTPLHTMRMEQASSEMNFLPTAVNEFTYTTEKGNNLNYGLPRKYGDVVPCDTWQQPYTCIYSTCEDTCETCDAPTCPDTCGYTCDDPTCGGTCDDPTCYVTSCGEKTCSGPYCDK